MELETNVELKYVVGINDHDVRMIKSTFDKSGIFPPKEILEKIKSLGSSYEKFNDLYNHIYEKIQEKYERGIIHEDSKMVRFVFNKYWVFPSKKNLEEINSLSENNNNFKNLSNYLNCFNVVENFIR